MIRHPWYRLDIWFTVGLVAIALFTFHALSSLVFTILVLVPSSPQWVVALLLGSLFTIAGAAIGLQSLRSRNHLVQWATGITSGAASVALVGCYGASELGGQQAAILGMAIGFIVGGGFGFWSVNRRGWGHVILSTLGSLCAYGAAFSLSGWALAALNTQRWGLALVLGLLAGLYLWITQRTVKWTYRQWQDRIGT